MMLLVAIVTGAQAQETLFSWTSKTGLSNADISAGTYTFTTASPGDYLATLSGGTVEMVVPSNGNMRIRNSELAYNSNNSYFKITLSQALAAGDQILVNSSGNTNNLYFMASQGRPSSDSNADAMIVQGTAYELASSNALVGQTEFYVYRKSSTTEVGTFTITRPAASDDPKITASDASVKATESGVAATTTIDVTGTNLTGSTLTATLSPAVTGLSVSLDTDEISDGSITATATLSYTATENAKGTTTLTISDGTTSKEVTVSYQAKVVSTPLATISEATTWNFSTDVTYSGSGDYQFTGDDLTTEFVYTDLDLTFADTFNSDALAFTGEYPFRSSSKKYAQNGTLHFKTSVPGTITVKFSDTGTSASSTAVKRYLVVNGETTEYWTSRENNGDEPYDAQLNVTTDEIAVAAGDVTIAGTGALIYSIITFTPATTETITIPADEVATYVTQNALDFSSQNGAFKAYTVTAVSNTSATTAEVTVVPAGTALLLKGAEGSYDVEIATSAEPVTNLLKASNGTVTGGDDIFAYSKTNKKFMKVATTVTIPAGKAYLQADLQTESLDIDFEQATAVESVAEANAEAVAPVKVIKNGKLYIGNFNVAGQQVK